MDPIPQLVGPWTTSCRARSRAMKMVDAAGDQIAMIEAI
jgi:hypothetical protein